MVDPIEDAVARHDGVSEPARSILDALTASGLDPARLRPEDLAPVDEFQIGGRAATFHAIAKMGLKADDNVLDIGCGIGGASRDATTREKSHNCWPAWSAARLLGWS